MPFFRVLFIMYNRSFPIAKWIYQYVRNMSGSYLDEHSQQFRLKEMPIGCMPQEFDLIFFVLQLNSSYFLPQVQLSAHHLSISVIPLVITNSSPNAIMVHLDTALKVLQVSNQPQREASSWETKGIILTEPYETQVLYMVLFLEGFQCLSPWHVFAFVF